MTPKQLLQECETLTYQGRMRRMVELGRLAANDTSIGKTIITLAQGDVFQRGLAVQSCFGSRDSVLAFQALSDPSRSVRALALGLVALICSDDELQTALDIVPPDLKLRLLRALSRRRRHTAIDRYIETLASRHDAQLKKWFPFASREGVQRYLEQQREQLETAAWRRLARRYPDLVIEHMHARAISSESLDPQLVFQVNAVLPLLAHFTPDFALRLVRTMSATIPLECLDMQTLGQKRPNEVADLLLQTNEQSHVRFDAVAHRLDTERLLALFTRYPGTISTHCFPKLTPEQRLVVYTTCERGWRNAEGALPSHVVANLPTAHRTQEGRRHLGLPTLVTRPLERLRYASYLPWDEARSILDTPLRSPDADLRGVAIRALIAATCYQRDHLADVLQIVRRRRNEQDPARREMLTALAELPPSMWHEEHLDDLAQILRDALDATDLSHATAQAVERLVVHLFPFYPQWSAGQIAIVCRERGHLSCSGLDQYLSNADIRRIAPLLTPVLQSWQRRESEGLLISLASALGERLRVFDEFLDLLEATVQRTLNPGIADRLLHLLLKYRKQHAAQLIPRLLQQDKSCIVIPAVSTYLHRYRQDLLTPFLGQHAYKGRFSTGKTRMVLPLGDGFFRWTPTQQERFAHTLLEVIDKKDQHRATYELLSTIHRLAAMPALDATSLIQFASDTRQVVCDAALQALGTLDAGQGIPTLLAALNDERARIAIYALRGALLCMPRAEALNLLRHASLAQVTVAKEVVRLIGDLSSEAAYRELLALNARDLHRDVRVALLRALWPYVEQEETWKIFTCAAQSPEAALARGVVDIPADGMSPVAQKRLAALIAILLAHPEPEVRIDALRRCSERPLADDGQLLFSRLLSLLNSNSPDECSLAAKAVFAIFTGKNASLVGNAIEGVLSNRRALHMIVENFLAALRRSRHRLLPTTRAVLAALARDPLTLSLRIDIIVSGLPWDEVAPELRKLADGWHADALNRAERAIQQASQRPDAQLLDLERAFATSSDEQLRRLALAALIAQSRKATGWSDECIMCLQRYWEDPSPLVAEAAQFTFPS